MCAYFNISSKSEINSFYKSDFTAQVTFKKKLFRDLFDVFNVYERGGGESGRG